MVPMTRFLIALTGASMLALAGTNEPLKTTLAATQTALKAPACKAPVRTANPLAPLNPTKPEPQLMAGMVCAVECRQYPMLNGSVEVCEIVCHYEAPDLPGCYPNCAD